MGSVGVGCGDFVYSPEDDLSAHGSDGDFLILGTNGLYLDDSSCVIQDLSSIVGAPVTGVLAAVWCSRQGRV